MSMEEERDVGLQMYCSCCGCSDMCEIDGFCICENCGNCEEIDED